MIGSNFIRSDGDLGMDVVGMRVWRKWEGEEFSLDFPQKWLLSLSRQELSGSEVAPQEDGKEE